MSLSKQQTVAVSSAAAFVLAAGALGWFLYDAYSGRMEQEEELAQQTAAFLRFNEAPVFPSLKTISEAKTNQATLATWLDSARAYAARGDRKMPEETPPIFKQRLAATVRKMRMLPGAAAGKIAAPAFQFGFDAYLGEGGVLPDVKDVPRLSSQLDAIKYIVAVFARAGVLEVKELRRVEPPPPDETPAKGRKPKAKKKADDAAGEQKASSLEFGLVFTARPDAIVKVMNAFSSDTRFVIVKNFAFKAVEDDIVSRMDADAAAKAAAANASGSGRRRRRAAAEAAASEEPADAAKGGVIADPESGSPLQVEFTLEVWDFGTGTIQGAAPSSAAAKNAKADAGGQPSSAAAKKVQAAAQKRVTPPGKEAGK